MKKIVSPILCLVVFVLFSTVISGRTQADEAQTTASAARTATTDLSWKKFSAMGLDATFAVGINKGVKSGLLTKEEGKIWKNLLRDFKQSRIFSKVVPVTVDYWVSDTQGNLQALSGVVIVPIDRTRLKNPRSVPMLSFQHPTQIERQYAPSTTLKNGTITADPQYNIAFAMFMALSGYIVVIPDYPGMGTNVDVHPYCHSSLAGSVLGIVVRGRDAVENEFGGVKGAVKWDGSVYLMGYSEGAYASMVAAKSFQTTTLAGFDVKGVAALDGPYSLSKVMKQLMTDSNPSYGAPYFLPYLINGYDAVYYSQASNPNKIEDFNYNEIIRPTAAGVEGNYAEQLRALLDGSHPSETVDSFMRLVDPYDGPVSSLQQSFIDKLSNETGIVMEKLRENDSFSGWTPQMPLMMFHHMDDELVSYDNAVEALKSFVDAGAYYVGLMPYNVNLGAVKSIHVSAVPVAYMLGFDWINNLAGQENPSRLKWAGSTGTR